VLVCTLCLSPWEECVVQNGPQRSRAREIERGAAFLDGEDKRQPV